MVDHIADEEQVEALKNWWKANGGAVISGIVIGLVVIFGWQYWSTHRTRQAEQASLQYEALNQALKQADAQQISRQGQALLDSYPSSFYAVSAAFQLAKLAVDQGDNEAAAHHLQWIVDNTREETIKDIARLRLARVLVVGGKLDDAQARLGEVSSTHFTAELEELKGDLYLARNEPAKARAAYQAALSAQGDSALLQMKLDNLPVTAAPQG